MSNGQRNALIVLGVVIVVLLGLLVGVVIGRGTSKTSLTASATPTATTSTSTPSASESPRRQKPSESPTPSESPAILRKATFHAYNVTLPNSEGGTDSGIRILVDSPDTSLMVRVNGGVPSPNATLFVCPVKDLSSRFVPTTCDTPSNNELVKVPHGTSYAGVEVILIGVGPGGSPDTTVGQIRVQYHGASGDVQIRTPYLAKPFSASVCKDNGCNPFFEMTPQRTGHFTAVAEPTASGSHLAQLNLESGDIVAHAFAATGVPYDVIDSMEGGLTLKVSGRISATQEAALSLRNFSNRTLKPYDISITWP